MVVKASGDEWEDAMLRAVGQAQFLRLSKLAETFKKKIIKDPKVNLLDLVKEYFKTTSSTVRYKNHHLKAMVYVFSKNLRPKNWTFPTDSPLDDMIKAYSSTSRHGAKLDDNQAKRAHDAFDKNWQSGDITRK